jgi:DNA-binding transcriptional MocR family regulator
MALPFGDSGPDPDQLSAWFGTVGSGSRFFYTVPALHNPTGLRHSLERKKEIARIASFLDVTIVEDDYLSELLPERGTRYIDLVPERTIWIKSLSKTTAPGIRIGILAAPAPLLSSLLRLRAESDPGPATWLQLFAAGILDSGLYDRHIEEIRGLALRRRAELLELLSPHHSLSPTLGGEGFNLWVRAKSRSQAPSASWAEGYRFGRSPATRLAFRLSFMGIGEAEWLGAKKRLSEALYKSYPEA